MGELEDKLNSILSSPREMEKIMALARSLAGSGAGTEPPGAGTGDRPEHPAGTAGPGGDVDPRLMERVTRLLGAYSAAGNGKLALVSTMRPYLREGSYQRLQRAAEIARLARAARTVFGGGREGHV